MYSSPEEQVLLLQVPWQPQPDQHQQTDSGLLWTAHHSCHGGRHQTKVFQLLLNLLYCCHDHHHIVVHHRLYRFLRVHKLIQMMEEDFLLVVSSMNSLFAGMTKSLLRRVTGKLMINIGGANSRGPSYPRLRWSTSFLVLCLLVFDWSISAKMIPAAVPYIWPILLYPSGKMKRWIFVVASSALVFPLFAICTFVAEGALLLQHMTRISEEIPRVKRYPFRAKGQTCHRRHTPSPHHAADEVHGSGFFTRVVKRKNTRMIAYDMSLRPTLQWTWESLWMLPLKSQPIRGRHSTLVKGMMELVLRVFHKEIPYYFLRGIWLSCSRLSCSRTRTMMRSRIVIFMYTYEAQSCAVSSLFQESVNLLSKQFPKKTVKYSGIKILYTWWEMPIVENCWKGQSVCTCPSKNVPKDL